MSFISLHHFLGQNCDSKLNTMLSQVGQDLSQPWRCAVRVWLNLYRTCLCVCALTRGSVNKSHLQPCFLPDFLQLSRVRAVQPSRLHSLETCTRSCSQPLAHLGQLREQPGNVSAKFKRCHVLSSAWPAGCAREPLSNLPKKQKPTMIR